MKTISLSLCACLFLLTGCQTKGERKAPCPALTSYAEGDAICGPLQTVNDPFEFLLDGK